MAYRDGECVATSTMQVTSGQTPKEGLDASAQRTSAMLDQIQSMANTISAKLQPCPSDLDKPLPSGGGIVGMVSCIERQGREISDTLQSILKML